MRASRGATAHDTSGFTGTDLERLAEVGRLAVVALEAMRQAQSLVYANNGWYGTKMWSAASRGVEAAVVLGHAVNMERDAIAMGGQ